MNKILFLVLIVAFSITSCSESPPSIEGFDSTVWIKDQDGCKNDRKSLIKLLFDNKSELLDKRESEIISFLGKPDKNELYTRSQKFFIYQINPSEKCDNPSENKGYLQIKFNALGRSNEILLIDFEIK